MGVILLLLLVTFSTVGFYMLERGWSLAEAFFMSIITVSTVGYGEVRPLSQWGRVLASVVIVSGLVIAAYTSAKLGQVILEGELFGDWGKRRMIREIKKLKDHFILCGYGRVGRPVAEGLRGSNRAVCILDASTEIAEELGTGDFYYLTGDATEDELLEAAGVSRARVLLALLPSDADNLFLTITAKGLNPNLTVIARANDPKAAQKLRRGGADQVISPYEITSARVLHAALRPTVVEFMELATHREHLELSIEEMAVGADSPLMGKTIEGAGIRNSYGVIVVAIKRPDGQMIFNPSAKEEITGSDILVTIGPRESLERMQKDCTGSPAEV